ncbi:hypothetical protein Tco_0326816 [Tanacetum coccineum]
MKDAYPAHRGPLPPVVFREPDSGKLQPLPNVQGKGKEKVGEEQAAQVLLNLQTPKKKNPAEQFIFQRRTPAIAEPSSLVETSSLYAELGLTDSGTESDEEVSPEMSAQGQEEGQGGTNPGDAGVSQTPSSHVNLKLPTEGEVRLEEPASSVGTLSSMKNLNKDLSLTDQFHVEKSQENEPEKTNTEVEVQSMVTVPIHQDTSSVPLMTTPVIDITDPQSNSTMVPASMTTTKTTVTKTTTTTTTVPPPPPQPQQDVSTSILIQTIGQLEQNITNLVDANQALEERLDKQGNRIHQLETQDLSRMIREQTHAMRAPLYARLKNLPTSDMKEILLQRIEQFDAGKVKEQTKKKSKQDSPKTPPGSPPPPPPPLPLSGVSGASGPTGASDSTQDPPPPPPSSTTNRGDKSQSSAAPGLSKTTALIKYTAWTTTTSRLKPAASSVPEDVLIHEESDFKAQDMGSNDEDSGSRHIPKVSLNQEWFKPLSEKERPATPKPSWSIPSSMILECSLIGSARSKESHSSYQNIWKVLLMKWSKPSILTYNISRPLPLGGPPGQVTIQTEFFFNKDLEYLRFGHKGDRLAVSITKMKAASYLDAGLEQMVPDQMWAEEEYMYDISASYGISYWWFKRQQFYIDRHLADTNRRAIVRTHMRILSVIRIKVFSLYGYDYLKKIVLQRADNQEYTIAKSDFKDLYPSDFEDLYLLNLQGHLNHLSPKDKRILCLEFMHDYKILDSSRAVVFGDRYGMQMIMQFNEIYKFSDKTLQQIDEALDYRVKEFKVNKVNPGLNTRFWTKNDVIKSKQFMFAIQKRLKLRRIFWNLESFVGERIREEDYKLLQRTE